MPEESDGKRVIAPLLKICALWEGTTKDGQYKLSGNLGDLHVMILKNAHKEKESQPDFYLYFTKRLVLRQGFNKPDTGGSDVR